MSRPQEVTTVSTSSSGDTVIPIPPIVNEKSTAAESTPPIQSTMKKNEVIGVLKDPPTVLHGFRLGITVFGLSIALFLSSLETTIVATSLLRIGTAFNAYEEVNWVVVSYMLTYTGFLVIFAKMSDIFGKKNMLLIGVAIFFIFSLACGASQNLISLVVCRAFQGLGASGIYSMVTVTIPVIVPARRLPSYMAVVAVVYTLSSVLGPLMGGAITVGGGETWRWVFWLNGPPGVLVIGILLFSLPPDIQTSTEAGAIEDNTTTIQTTPHSQKRTFLQKITPQLGLSGTFTKSSLKRIDFLGSFLLLTFSLLLVFSLQEGGSNHPWNSPLIITTLTLSLVSFFLFIIWEELFVGDFRHTKYLSEKLRNHRFLPSDVCEAIFPMRLVKQRIPASLMASGFFAGFPFMSVVFTLPQRFQVVHLLSSAQAGIRLFPVLITSSFATAAVGIIVTKIGKGNTKVLWYCLVFGAFSQFLGVLLLGTDTSEEWIKIPVRVYIYEGITGMGVGLLLTSLVIEVRVDVDEADLSVAQGAVTQVRVLGGCVALAICSAVLNHHVVDSIKGILTSEEMARVLESAEYMRELDAGKFEAVRRVYANGFSLQLKVMVGFAGMAVLSTLGAWKRVWKVFEGLGMAKDGDAVGEEEESVESKVTVVATEGKRVSGA